MSLKGYQERMPPDFLLACGACGTEAVWDTEALPPAGEPEVGHPVLWYCARCAFETRHEIRSEVLLVDKLHREICVATELDRETVDRVMGEIRRRQPAPAAGLTAGLLREPGAVEAIAAAGGVSPGAVREILRAESAWAERRGYVRGA